MSVSDPQVVTINAVPYTLARISSETNKSVYSTADGSWLERIGSTYGKRYRRTIRLEGKKIAANPFDTSLNQEVGFTVQLVVDIPPQGFTVTEQKDAVVGLINQLTASSNALLLKILGGEN